MKTRLVSFLGTTLDYKGSKPKRWEAWRPNPGVGASTGCKIDVLMLIYEESYATLAHQVRDDALKLAADEGRDFEVILKEVTYKAFDMPSTYLMLDDLRQSIDFDPNDTHLLNISTGTHISQICCYKMIETKRWPGYLAQCSRDESSIFKTNVKVIDLDLAQYDPIMNRYRAENMDRENFLKLGIPTRNEAFNRTIAKLQKVAERSDSPILLLGPTGAGKTQLARRVFETKKQVSNLKGRFVEVNCATLRGDTVMSTLFGHRKGAFTGAIENRQGLLKEADGGLLFLDEIGELGLEEQAMLLHALEDKLFTPMGSNDPVKSDFQFIAGTNRDLNADVAAGRFRGDLLARINTWTFRLPGLADRLEDLEPNLDFELAKQQSKNDMAYRFAGKARQMYLSFAVSSDASWAGNFRDLASSVERMTVMADGGVIDEEVVRDELEALRAQWGTVVSLPDKVNQVGDVSLIELVGFTGPELTPADRKHLEYVLSLCKSTSSYAELGRRLYGDQAGSNPSQRVRKYLMGFGMEIKAIHAKLNP
ncbi:RNA repair transcriptional activator RtcR family protein [Pseudomonas aeruginosa]